MSVFGSIGQRLKQFSLAAAAACGVLPTAEAAIVTVGGTIPTGSGYTNVATFDSLVPGSSRPNSITEGQLVFSINDPRPNLPNFFADVTHGNGSVAGAFLTNGTPGSYSKYYDANGFNGAVAVKLASGQLFDRLDFAAGSDFGGSSYEVIQTYINGALQDSIIFQLAAGAYVSLSDIVADTVLLGNYADLATANDVVQGGFANASNGWAGDLLVAHGAELNNGGGDVPEPASVLLAVTALAGLAAAHRRTAYTHG